MGVFSNQKSQFGEISEGLATEDIGLFYTHLVYFTTIWYRYLVCCTKKNLATLAITILGRFAHYISPKQCDRGGSLRKESRRSDFFSLRTFQEATGTPLFASASIFKD
jgi:hypothetical protein